MLADQSAGTRIDFADQLLAKLCSSNGFSMVRQKHNSSCLCHLPAIRLVLALWIALNISRAMSGDTLIRKSWAEQ